MALKLLDVNKFLGQEQAKAVTNPRSFTTNKEPQSGGLQDPSIFGVSTKDKFSTWGSINLEDVIMHPVIYDNLNIVSPVFKRVLEKKTKVELVKGELKESESGGTGLSWIISKWDKINLDLYRTEKNRFFIDFLKNTSKNILFINKIPVIPIVYREAHMGNFMMESDELDEIYAKILNVSKTGRSEFTSEWMQAFKDLSNKDILQDRVNQLFKHFISKIEGKRGFLRSLSAKRLDNVARMVANARPDIPINSCVIPWHILLNVYDIFVVAWIENDEKINPGVIKSQLGIGDKSTSDYGELFDYIYRNSETYEKHYPGKKEVWVKILTDIFNENPMMRVLVKRDPAWNADSTWVFQPLINTENSYQIWVPSWVYSPLGGDSLNTNFFITKKDTSVIYEDNDFIIEGDSPKARVVKTMDSVWKNS